MHHLPAWVRRFFESFPWTSQRLQAFIQSACFGEHTSEPDVERDETRTVVDLGIISEDEELTGAAVAEHKDVQMMSSTASSSSRRLLGKICSNVLYSWNDSDHRKRFHPFSLVLLVSLDADEAASSSTCFGWFHISWHRLRCVTASASISWRSLHDPSKWRLSTWSGMFVSGRRHQWEWIWQWRPDLREWARTKCSQLKQQRCARSSEGLCCPEACAQIWLLLNS